MIRFFLLALMLAQTAFGAGKQLQFWHSMTGDNGKLLASIVAEFNAKNTAKGFEIVPQFVGSYEEGLNKLRTSLLAKKGPHLVQITDIGTQVMIDSGAVTPLQDLIGTDAEFPLKEILPGVRRYYEIGGKFYSLPFATSNPILYYNVDAFQKANLKRPPETFAEMETYSRVLSDKSSKVTGITWPLHSWFFEQFLAMQGKPLLNNDNGRKQRATEALYTAPEAVEFVSLWNRMVKEGSFANVGRGWEPAEQNFLAGRSTMLITSTSDVFNVIKKAKFRVMTAPIPKRFRENNGGTIVGGNSLWVLNHTPPEEQKMAYEFLKYMASKDAQRKWHTNTGYFPIRQDLIADLEKEGFYEKFPAARTAINQLKASPEIPATAGALMGVFSEARVHVESAIERVLSGQAEPKEALAKAKSQTDEALVRYNKTFATKKSASAKP